MIQTIITYIIVAAAAYYVGKEVWNQLRPLRTHYNSDKTSCGGCSGCKGPTKTAETRSITLSIAPPKLAGQPAWSRMKTGNKQVSALAKDRDAE